MTAVQEIQAAIEKLEWLKVASTPGSWSLYESYNRLSIHSSADRDSPLIDAGDFATSCESFENPFDAELIVTLHRTIDAQLEILLEDLEQAKCRAEFPEYWYAPPSDQTINLARAINGPTS